MARVIQCDRCKSITRNSNEYNSVTIGKLDAYHHIENKEVHLCDKCMNEVFSFLEERKESD